MSRDEELADLLGRAKLDGEELLRAAAVCYGNDDLERAERILRTSLEVTPDEPRALKLLGSVLFLLERHIDAQAVYGQILAADPDDLYALVALAELKLMALELDEAEPLLARLFAADPAGTHPAANRGRKLLEDLERQLGG